MNNLRNSWAFYSAGVFVVWLLVLFFVWRLGTATPLTSVTIFLGGYVFGWLSATIKHFLIVSSNRPGLRN